MPFHELIAHRPSTRDYRTRDVVRAVVDGVGLRRGADGCTIAPLDIGVQAIQP